jgi:hypothetical protein
MNKQGCDDEIGIFFGRKIVIELISVSSLSMSHVPRNNSMKAPKLGK